MNLTNTGDFPTISASNYGTTTGCYTVSTDSGPVVTLNTAAIQRAQGLLMRGRAWERGGVPDGNDTESFSEPETKNQIIMAKRIVRVYLADTDDNLPLEKCLLYTGSEKLTDATDQELYFEIPILMILTEHNAYRKTVTDKKATNRLGKEVFLEPVKIRDLKMTVVNIATF